MEKSTVYAGNKRALIATILLIVILFSASYAYFTSYNNANATYSVGIDNGLNITYLLTAGSELNLTVNPAQMGLGGVDYVESSVANDVVTLDNASEYPDLVCDYEIWYEPTTVFTNSSTNTENLTEFELIGTDSSGQNADFSYDLGGVSTAIKVYSGKIVTNAGALNISQTWNFTLRHYNLALNQNEQMTKSYGGKVYFKAGGCEEPTFLSNSILAKVSANDYASSQGGTVYRVVDQNGVRYEGSDPDNYLEFNDEKWRIIGVFDGTDIGLEPGKKYTKIILSEPYKWDGIIGPEGPELFKMPWDNIEPYENDWVNSSLYRYLNGEYLSSLSNAARKQIAKYNNQYSLWHLLGPSVAELYGTNLSGLYDAERSGIPGNRNGIWYAANTNTNAAIGLMYLSDYGYASYGSDCDNENITGGYLGSCESVNWLVTTNDVNFEWTITPVFSNDYIGSVAILGNGTWSYTDDTIYDELIRPTLYLDYSIMIDTGNGTYSSPYILK